jgi:cysteine synthase A
MTQAALSERRAWNAQAIRRIEADITRTSDTHLINHAIEGTSQIPGGGITLYFKDESSHPTGSLKHRLARSLFLYACATTGSGPTPR